MVVRGPAIPLLALLLALTAPPGGAAATDDTCLSTCPEINPRILLDVDLPRTLASSGIADLPEVVDVAVRYTWDMEREGTGVPGPNPTEIRIDVTRTPDWLDVTLSETSCPHQPLPHRPDEEVCVIQMRLQVTGTPSAADFETTPRLMLFAQSDATGTYNAGFGVAESRWEWDGAPPGAPNGETRDAPLVPAGATLAAVGAMAALLAGLGAVWAHRAFRPRP